MIEILDYVLNFKQDLYNELRENPSCNAKQINANFQTLLKMLVEHSHQQQEPESLEITIARLQGQVTAYETALGALIHKN